MSKFQILKYQNLKVFEFEHFLKVCIFQNHIIVKKQKQKRNEMKIENTKQKKEKPSNRLSY